MSETDNPSSGPSKGEEITASVWVCAHGKVFLTECRDPDCIAEDRRQSARLIDSALASQEARHREEMAERESEQQSVLRRAYERAAKTEQELAEAKGDKEVAENRAEERLQRCASLQREVCEYEGLLSKTESKLREAEAREKVLREVGDDLSRRLATIHLGGSDSLRPAAACGDCEAVAKWAALCSGPAPRPHVCTYECANTDCEHVVGPAPQEQTDAEPAEGWPCKCGHGRYSCVPECPCQSYEPKGEPG